MHYPLSEKIARLVIFVLMLNGSLPRLRGVEAGQENNLRNAVLFDVNVRSLGAIGDGIADDGPIIRRAVEQITAHGSGTLSFPPGSYRCGRESGTVDGIKFSEVGNIKIDFATGAELVMDNLNPKTGTGDRGHGVYICGPAKNVTLVNVKVRWAKTPIGRSQGDGFRFGGFPENSRTISNIFMENCAVEKSPQAGAIFMGCSNVKVVNLAAIETKADGLHFNACQKVSVKGYRAFNNGDDGLAFVTYAPGDTPDSAKGPFSVPQLGEWSNTDSDVSNVEIEGGRANGIRISGALRISLNDLRIKSKSAGVIVDAGKKDVPRVGWSYEASREIKINNLRADNCDIGFMVINHNVFPTDAPRWWNFDVEAQNLHVETSVRYGICLTRCAGVRLADCYLGKTELRKEGVKDFVSP